MSLKWFHLVFLTVCSLLCVTMAIWGVANDVLWLAAVAVASGVTLTVYGNWFLRKARKIGL